MTAVQEPQTQTETRTRCALCGHEMTLEMCGSASVDSGDVHFDLCHVDTHDCYRRWTVYGERPITEDDERVGQIDDLVLALNNAKPNELTAFFYMHAYNELHFAVEDLLAIVKRLRP